MRRHWDEETLTACWTLAEDELALLQGLSAPNCLGMAVQLKFFQMEGRVQGRFPRALGEIPVAGLDFLAAQLQISREALFAYDLQGRSAGRHRRAVREFFGFRLFLIKFWNI